MSISTYTYQGGKPLALSHATAHFISRATQEALLENNFKPLREISPHSWSVATTRDRLEDDLQRARRLAPAYPAYIVTASGAPLLVTDRIFVRFRHPLSAIEAHQFGERFGLS